MRLVFIVSSLNQICYQNVFVCFNLFLGACGGQSSSYDDAPKSKEVDCYNPNIYNDIEELRNDKNEHFYDEVKFKALDGKLLKAHLTRLFTLDCSFKLLLETWFKLPNQPQVILFKYEAILMFSLSFLLPFHVPI